MSRIDVPPGAGILSFITFMSSGRLSRRIFNEVSAVQDSTAAEKVCRLQTLATVGSPIKWEFADFVKYDKQKAPKEGFQNKITRDIILLTGKDVLMNPRQLDVSLHRVCDNEAVDDTFRNRFCHGMAQIALYLQWSRLHRWDI